MSLVLIIISILVVLTGVVLLASRSARQSFVRLYFWFGGEDLTEKPHVYYCGVIGIVCTVLGAVGAILVFRQDVQSRLEDRKYQFAIDRKTASLKYVERLADNERLNVARTYIELFLVRPDIRKELTSLTPEQLPASFKRWIEADADLERSVWQMYDFYDGLAGCIDSEVCDPGVACDAFSMDLLNFSTVTQLYFKALEDIHYGTEYLERINSALSHCAGTTKTSDQSTKPS